MFGLKVETDEDGKIKDLPPLLKFIETFRWLAQWYTNPIIFAAFVQWITNTWRAEIRHRREHGDPGVFGSGLIIPHNPVKFEVFNFLTGMSCSMIRNELRGYGIPAQLYDIGFELWPDRRGIGLYFSFLVPARQAWLARVVLEWTSGSGSFFYVMSSPGIYGDDRGDPVAYAMGHKPWQWQGKPPPYRSFDERISQVFISWFGGDRCTLAYRARNAAGKETEVEAQDADGEHLPGTTQKPKAKRKKPKAKKTTPKKGNGVRSAVSASVKQFISR